MLIIVSKIYAISHYMTKKQKSNSQSKPKISIYKLVGIGIIIAIAVGVYYVYESFIPVNADYPVFLVPENILIKTGKSADGQNVFATQSSRGGKQTPHPGMSSPTLNISKGSLVDVHIINEILNTPEEKSLHNFNIDEFNVHSKDLGYFDSQSITFLADKTGSFPYYCSLHPEMKGMVIIK